MPDLIVDDLWLGGRRGPTALRADAGALTVLAAAPPDLPRVPVSVLPGIVDRHVHLGLVDAAALADGPVVEVHDLGWDPVQAVRWRDHPPAGVRVRIAGRFHTAPGGYPSGRSWAPDAGVRAVTDAEDAARAVAEVVGYGATFLKIVLHADMPLLADDVLAALVEHAHHAGLPAGVHAEGRGQAERAIDAGADVLVHAPWTERLDDAVLRRGTHMTWISTLAIHEGEARAVATDNIRRFRALGGRVVYGTDMGNGPTPVGVNEEEILALGSAGLDGDDLLAAVTGEYDDELPLAHALMSPLPLPTTAAELIAWLRTARRFEVA